MRTKTPEWVNKDSRIKLLTTEQRLLAEISHKLTDLIRITKGTVVKSSKEKPGKIVELMEEKGKRIRKPRGKGFKLHKGKTVKPLSSGNEAS